MPHAAIGTQIPWLPQERGRRLWSHGAEVLTHLVGGMTDGGALKLIEVSVASTWLAWA
jgi:hypothetical protein